MSKKQQSDILPFNACPLFFVDVILQKKGGKGMKRFFYRVYQKIMYIGMFFMPWRKPQIISGEGSFAGVFGTVAQGAQFVQPLPDAVLQCTGAAA